MTGVPSARLRPFIVPAVPFLVSLSLSLSTVSSHVHWQDSGFYLAAIHDMGVLYPPGFAVYQILCRIWTAVFSFLDFVLAVHLFSSLCAALAAGFLAVAARALLSATGPLFRTEPESAGARLDVCAIAAGVLAACGYTFWVSGIFAKGYAFYYLLLTLLLWRMIRADETGSRRDFTIVAALIGLAWQAHPSATLTGVALILFTAAHVRKLGAKGLAGRAALAAAVAIGPIFMIPLVTDPGAAVSFSDLDRPGDFVEFIVGGRFTGHGASFGWEASRVSSVGQYLWEEMLGVGLVAATFGLVRLVGLNKRLLLGAIAWIVPLLVVTVFFRIEGQHDHWFVGAWLPLYLASAIGFRALARKAGTAAVAGAAAAALLWSVLANYSLVEQRTYDLAEVYGRLYLEPLEDDAVILVATDDAVSIGRYLQAVRGVQPGVVLLHAFGDLEGSRPGTPHRSYLRMMKLHPFLKPPDFEGARRRFPGAPPVAAFLHANADSGRPIYLDFDPPPQLLPEGTVAVKAGPFSKIVKRGAGKGDFTWDPPVTPEEVQGRIRRKRGQWVGAADGRRVIRPEAYEERLLALLRRAER